MFCPSSEGIIGGRWLGRWVGDSKAFEDSAPGLEFAVEWSVLSILERDV